MRCTGITITLAAVPQVPLNFEVDRAFEGPDAVLRLRGELDLSSVDVLRAALAEAACCMRSRSLVLDLDELEFMDATGLRLFLEAARRSDMRVSIRSPRPQVWRLFEVTGLAGLLPLQPDPLQNVEYVRRICEAFVAGGPAAMAELVPADVEWVPWQANGARLHSTAEMQAHWARSPSAAPTVTELSAVGRDVLVRFEIPLQTGSVKELWSLYQFEFGRLVRAISYEDRATAVAQAG